MEFIKKDLCRGVTLGVIPTDRAKTDSLIVSFSLPLDGRVTEYALLSRVIMRGTREYPSLLALSRRSRELYNASVGVSTSRLGETLTLTFSMSCLKNRYAYGDEDVFGGTLTLLSGMIFDPYLPDGCFDEAYTESEKHMLADAIRAQINNKNRYALTRCTAAMCQGEPYSIPPYGKLEDIDCITPSALLEALADAREGAPVKIIYAGEIPADEIAARVAASLNFAPRADALPAASASKAPKEIKNVTETMDIVQAKLAIGFRCGITLRSPDFIKYALFNEIFGGGTTSKLFMNVREKLSLCYYCQSITDGHKDVMFVISGIESENFEKARDAILGELSAVQRGEISAEEFDNAVKSLKNGYTEITDSPASLCMWYLSRLTAGRSDSPEDAANAVSNVTPDDIREIAAAVVPDTVYLLKGAEK